MFYTNFLFQSTPHQREKFRKFVERSGIMELVTNALVELYEEQLQEPEEAMEYFRTKIASNSSKEIEALRIRVQELEGRLAFLQRSEEKASA